MEKQLTCDLCGGTDLIKREGVYLCQGCGTQYTLDEVRKMMDDGSPLARRTLGDEAPIRRPLAGVNNNGLAASGYANASLAAFYQNFLAEEGYRASIDNDGDVAFKAEGRNYYISVDEDDPQYFRLIYPRFWEIESEDERERAIKACLETTKGVKVAKLYMIRDNFNVSASVEAFFASLDDVKRIFPRYLNCLQGAVSSFAESMKNG
jgi:hypothetical protein